VRECDLSYLFHVFWEGENESDCGDEHGDDDDSDA
jgi:hypothetical protein